jgi:hypothetical protein
MLVPGPMNREKKSRTEFVWCVAEASFAAPRLRLWEDGDPALAL